ncbi:hypothetical protein LOK49_LG10G02575 [Camellia lanceoleosa]|uniref:Uncharacterized protein n=1 Tax=Camellia lanceoleosa TaxID=1840588 RepID=A0ACC0GCI1_9ERIC|nr:hypothetical protein LOK49_LG10G02575 [Camellia lanceoleosa]
MRALCNPNGKIVDKPILGMLFLIKKLEKAILALCMKEPRLQGMLFLITSRWEDLLNFYEDQEAREVDNSHIYAETGYNFTSCIQAPFNLKRKKNVNASILNLFKVEPLIVPPTHCDPFGLLNLLPQHLFRQVVQPRIAKLDHSAVSRQGAKINSGGHRQPIILNQPLDIDVNTHTHKRVDRVVEEVEERFRDVKGVGELEDEATAANAELESGGGVVVETVIGSPLDV